MPNSGPKNTIYVTSIPAALDRADVFHFYEACAGFRRFCFHQDYAFADFDSVANAKRAIEHTHARSSIVAAFARNDGSAVVAAAAAAGAPHVPVIAPNPTLYIATPSYFSERDMGKIVSRLDGVEHVRAFPGHSLVRFVSTAAATFALQVLSLRTNLSVNFSSKGASKPSALATASTSPVAAAPCGVQGAATAAGLPSAPTEPEAAPKRTIHLTNIPRDKLALKQFVGSLPGFVRIAFFQDYCFAVYDSPLQAGAAIDQVVVRTKIKASFAKAEFAPHEVPESQIGTPNTIVRVSDYPSFLAEASLRALFGAYAGCLDITVYHSSCLVRFASAKLAEACLRDINATTNFCAVFSRKGAALQAAQSKKQAPLAVGPRQRAPEDVDCPGVPRRSGPFAFAAPALLADAGPGLASRDSLATLVGETADERQAQRPRTLSGPLELSTAGSEQHLLQISILSAQLASARLDLQQALLELAKLRSENQALRDAVSQQDAAHIPSDYVHTLLSIVD